MDSKARSEATTAVDRYSYPPQAIFLVIASWAFLMLLIAGYMTIAIALFPLSPFIFGAGACLVGAAHEYAVSVRKPVR